LDYRTRIRVYLVLIAAGLVVVGWLYWDTYRYQRALSGDPAQKYSLYAPPQCAGDRICPVFVFVHGTGGSGRDYIEGWRPHADDEGFVLVCPTFRLGYQTLDDDEDEALLAILDEVAQHYSIAPKAFVSGFSGGAQFAHRFAFAHPDSTQAVAVHSAGWYDPPPVGARQVPFLVTVGLNDTRRIEWARWFAAGLEREGYDVTLVEIVGVGHSLSEQAIQETLTLFRRLNN
jgi:poly(3-hydroxybutyrate) depolymerase